MITSDDYWDASDWESLNSGMPDWKPLYNRSDKVLLSNFKQVEALQRFKAAESANLYNDPDAGHSEVADLYNVYGMIFGFADHITK